MTNRNSIKDDCKMSPDELYKRWFETGDLKCFELLYILMGPFVYNSIRCKIHDEGRSEEMMNDIFVRLHNKRYSRPLETGIVSYLYSMVVTDVLQYWRRQNREKKIDFFDNLNLEKMDLSEGSEDETHLDISVNSMPCLCHFNWPETGPLADLSNQEKVVETTRYILRFILKNNEQLMLTHEDCCIFAKLWAIHAFSRKQQLPQLGQKELAKLFNVPKKVLKQRAAKIEQLYPGTVKHILYIKPSNQNEQRKVG